MDSIDDKTVQLVESMGSVFERYMEPGTNPEVDLDVTKEAFKDGVKKCYALLSEIAVALRDEVKAMDDNIGVYDRNPDGVMILPVEIEQKNARLGEQKMAEELEKI